jgi:hypothetical protein
MVGNSLTVPPGVIRPILLPVASVNQRLPSGPAAIPFGLLPPEMPVENSVTAPLGVIRPILLELNSVNQRLPSGPAAISTSWLDAGIPVEKLPDRRRRRAVGGAEPDSQQRRSDRCRCEEPIARSLASRDLPD